MAERSTNEQGFRQSPGQAVRDKEATKAPAFRLSLYFLLILAILGVGFLVRTMGVTPLVAQRMPADRFLIETDCPWLAPQFRRGKRNESAYVTAVAEKIAELRQTTAVEIGQVSSQNFRRLFL